MSPRLLALGALWISLVGAGFGGMVAYASAPSAAAVAPATWPAGVAIPRDGRPSLVVFLHPECPCSRATVAELARLLARAGNRIETHVVLVRPRGLTRDPEGSPLWLRARAIPGVDVRVDSDGRLASQFGTFTSGEVLLYDARGALRFAGGITASRGHEGDSDGRRALEAAIRGERSGAWAAVFGCSLLGGDR